MTRGNEPGPSRAGTGSRAGRQGGSRARRFDSERPRAAPYAVAFEPKDLVPVEAVPLPDPYERKYMAGEGVVLFRDKSRAPWSLNALFLVAMATVTVTSLTVGTAFALLFSLPVLAIVWLFFVVLRVTVSQGAVNVQYGLFGPRIPIAAIESAEPITYDWKHFGGWGIRRARDGAWLYNMPGDGDRAVRIVWRGPKGRRKTTLIGTRHSTRLAAQIRLARTALPPGSGSGASDDVP